MSIVATPVQGSITEGYKARCSCSREIVLVKFNWQHTDDGSHVCKRQGKSGQIQQDS
jgi:hypothetical protein